MTTDLRVLSWNLHGAPVPGGESKTVQREAWQHLCGLNPDLVLLQEVNAAGIRDWDVTGWTVLQGVVGRYAKGAHWGSVIAGRDAFDLRGWDAAVCEPGLAMLYDYVLTGDVRLPDGDRALLASVHSVAKPLATYAASYTRLGIPDSALPPLAALRRPGYPEGKPYVNDLAYRCLARQIGERRFLVGGDWNTSRGFGDEGGAFFRRADAEGWTECHQVVNGQETRSFFGEGTRAYQLDHLFCDRQSARSLLDCRIVDEPWARGLSDHAPVIAHFGFTASPDGNSTTAP